MRTAALFAPEIQSSSPTRRRTGVARRATRFLPALLLVGVAPVGAAIVVSPPTVTVTPGDTSGLVTVNLTYPVPGFNGVAELLPGGLPPGVSTLPSPVTFPVFTGIGNATASFSVATSPATPGGTYSIPLSTIPDLGAGTGTLTLVVLAPDFDVLIAPNPLTLRPGETRPMTVTTLPTGGFAEPLTFSFSGLPAGIDWGSPRVVAPPFPPVVFSFAAAPGTPPGTYPGTLVASWVTLGLQTKTFPVSVVVQAPQLAVAFVPSAIRLCDDGPAVASELRLDPGTSYAGTPSLAWLALPPGLEVSPALPTTPPLPPARSLPVSVRATGAGSGVRNLVLRASDPTAGIDTTATLLAEVVVGDFTPQALPGALTLSPGGAAQSLLVSLATSECFGAAAVTVTPIGLPHGVKLDPNAASIVAPGYAPATFAVRASPSARSGTYPVTLRFQPAGGSAHDVVITLTVAAAVDVALELSPAAVTVAAGETTSVQVRATGAGITGALRVTAPVLPFLAFTPTSFDLRLGETRTVELRARRDAPPGSTVGRFAATSPELAAPREAALPITVGAAADFELTVTPGEASVVAGGETAIRVAAVATGGFADSVTVAAPLLPGLAFTPAAFVLAAGAAREVRVRADAGAVAATYDATFVGAAAGVAGPRRATLRIAVRIEPPEITSASPPVLTAGTASVPMRLTGRRFQPGAVVTLSPPGPLVTATRVLSPTLAEIVVTTPPTVATGSYRIDLANPDGGRTEHGTTVVVCPPSSLATPLGVTTAAIVFPRPFASMSNESRLYPRALLATTGLGTLVGTWRLDGIPFDQFAVAASGGLPVEVTARVPVPLSFLGEHRLELVIEHPQRLATEPVPVIVSVASRSALEIFAPAEGVAVGGAPPLLRWSLVPGASGYEVEIAPAGDARRRRIRLSASQWRPDEKTLAALGEGRHRFRIAAVFPGEVRGEPTAWRTLEVRRDEVPPGPGDAGARTAELRSGEPGGSWGYAFAAMASDETGAAPDTAADASTHGDWQAALVGSATETDEEGHVAGDAGRLQLTTRGDLGSTRFQLKATGDVGVRKDLDPSYASASESRSWQLEAAALQPGWREEARIGYSPPDFLDQSEFLAAGLARGGAMAKVATPLGAFSYYDTFYSSAVGAASGLVGLDQNLTGAGWEAPLDGSRALVRVFGLRATGGANPLWRAEETEAEALGIFSRVTFGPGLTLLFEGARGTLDGPADGTAEGLEGYGFHLGASGVVGTFNYTFNLRKVDAELVNPANLGLTAGAVPDRFGGDLMLGKTLGTSTLSLELRRLESGSLADGGGAKVVEDAATLSLFAPLGGRVQLNLASNLTRTSSDGDPLHLLPGTDRSLLGLTATFSESLGSFSLSQSLLWQDLADDVEPAFDQRVTGLALSASGSLGEALALTTLLSGTRAEAAPPVGRSDIWLASLQPVARWSRAHLTFTPLVSYTRFDSELAGSIDTEQYQLIVDWAPGWWRSVASLQIAADWSRSALEGQATPAFHRRVVAGLALHWGLSRAQLQRAPLPPPLPTPARDPRGLAARTPWRS